MRLFRLRSIPCAFALAGGLALAVSTVNVRAEPSSRTIQTPPTASAFTPDGKFIPPDDYREWVHMSSGLDMSYSEKPSTVAHAQFDNVYVDPQSWKAFKATGHWPDKTVFILENRSAASVGSINRRGQFQTEEVLGLEAHVRDETRFTGGWGFFNLTDGAPAAQIAYSAQCYACHQAHGAVETTFTQFYPTAKPVAIKAGTFTDR